jgi:ABC-type branched-subunit amino acid transport system substrate-binding protein
LKRTGTTRRQLIEGLAGGLAVLAPVGILGGCAGVPPAGPPSTSALGPEAGTGARPSAEASEPAAKAALLLPLNAGIQMSLVAKGLQQAAELALFERNVPGFQLVVRDDRGTPEGAAAAATEAIASGAEIILGPLFGASVAAVAPVARKAGVPVIAFSNDPGAGGQGVHLVSFFSAAEATRVVEHAAGQGRRHFAALIPDDALGRDTEPAFRQAVERSGGRLALVEHYPADFSGMTEPSQRVMEAIRNSADSEAPIDALFLPSSTDNVARLAAMVRHHNLDTGKVKLLATSGWDNPAAIRDTRLHGAWLAAPDPGGWREFTARFGNAYNAMPPRVASLVHDAVTIAAAFATQPKGQRYTPANLTRATGFAGIDGPVRLTTAGLCERSLAVLELAAQGLVTVAPAAGFTGATPSASPGPVGAAPVTRG